MQIFKRKTEAFDELTATEPAKKNYFLDRGFEDIKATIREAFALNQITAQLRITKLKYAWATNTGVDRIALAILNICAVAALYVFGSLLTAIIAVLHAFIASIVIGIIYVCFGITKLIDHLYLSRNKIAVVCDKCHHSSPLPGFKCPNCGSIHNCLEPNVFGIVKHTCNCGQKLPCTFFWKTKNKVTGAKYARKDLEKVCANPTCQHMLLVKESRPLCIPVTGSRSVGKTAFITAVSHLLIENALPAAGCTMEFYDSEKERMYRESEQEYASGMTKMTEISTILSDPSAFSLSFYIDGPDISPRRLLHLFDIAGETFMRNEEHERQLQYSYSDGVILVIDPFSIPDLNDEYGYWLSGADKAGTDYEDPDRVLALLVAKIQNAGVLMSSEKIDIPIAVVINKIDEPGLDEFFGQAAIDAMRASCPEASEDEVEDALCRQFLIAKGMGNFTNTVDVNFKKARFFACSAIGHTRGAGKYNPVGVLDPIRWIIGNTDKTLAKKLGSTAVMAVLGGSGLV